MRRGSGRSCCRSCTSSRASWLTRAPVTALVSTNNPNSSPCSYEVAMTARIACSSRITLRDTWASGIVARPIFQALRLTIRSSCWAAKFKAAFKATQVRLTDACDIPGIAAAGFQIGLVGGERLCNGDRLGCPAAIRTGERAHFVLGLPEREHVIAVCIGEVVSRADRAHPTAALAIGDPHDPDAAALVAAISEPEAFRDPHEYRFDRYRQSEPRRARLEGS